MLAPFPEPAVNEIDAEPLPAVAVNDVGAPGAEAEKLTVQLPRESLPVFQLLSELPYAFTART
jgi:hypothetical protein